MFTLIVFADSCIRKFPEIVETCVRIYLSLSPLLSLYVYLLCYRTKDYSEITANTANTKRIVRVALLNRRSAPSLKLAFHKISNSLDTKNGSVLIQYMYCKSDF